MRGNLGVMDAVQERKFSVDKWLLWSGLLLVASGVAAGIYAQVIGHEHAFNNTREMPWGMLIGVYAYFAIISTGLCILAAFSHAFGGNRMAPLANRMVWLSIIMLLGAFFVIGLEIENPWRMPLGMVLHANPSSNIWWMGTLYGLAVAVMAIEFSLIYAKKLKAAFILGSIAAITEALANSNLGSVFASLQARPFWYGSQLPIFFLACAVLSGAAAIVLFTHYSSLLQRKPLSAAAREGMKTGGKVMVLMIFLVGLATAWKIANGYCGTEEMRMATDSLIYGPLAKSFWLFEVSVGLVIPLFLLVLSRLESLQALSAAALMVLVGQFFSRFNLVVAGLIVPQQGGTVGSPELLSYWPSVWEYLLVVGAIGLIGVGFVLGERIFAEQFASKKH